MYKNKFVYKSLCDRPVMHRNRKIKERKSAQFKKALKSEKLLMASSWKQIEHKWEIAVKMRIYHNEFVERVCEESHNIS